MSTRAKAQQLLTPYLAGGDMRAGGDLDMHCPIHGDKHRSAAVNFKTGEWYCNACHDGGSLQKLLDRRDEWYDPPEGAGGWSGKQKRKWPLPDSARLDGWQQALLGREDLLEFLEVKRGLSLDTIQRYRLGWDGKRYTIPVYDDTGVLKNIRCYSPVLEPKIIHWSGHGTPPRLYPMEVLLRDPKVVWICEGEFDALLANQQEVAAVTATAGAKQLGRWRHEWTSWFRGKTVYVCFDRDRDGEVGARGVAKHLEKAAKKIRVIELPFPLENKNGKDLTDYLLEVGSVRSLVKQHSKQPKALKRKRRYHDITYEDLRKGDVVGKAVRFPATLSAITERQRLLPDSINALCAVDWDPKRCSVCPCSGANGDLKFDVQYDYDLLLDLLNTSRSEERDKRYKRLMKIPPACPEVTLKTKTGTAWPAEVRNGSNLHEEAYTILIKQDGPSPDANYMYNWSGVLQPNPKGQQAVFIVHKWESANQDLDEFTPTPESIGLAREWVNSFSGSSPEEKIDQIASQFEQGITRIFGQRKLHIAIDLVYHSVLKFDFADGIAGPERGWMETLAVGETRSGKSSTARELKNLYDNGFLCSGENTTVAGLLAGVEKHGGISQEAWAISMGILPLSNRRLLIIDEAQGLRKEDIGQLSDVRSRGVADVRKIRSGTYPSRVRIIWLANPRQDSYRYGIEALKDQMGQREDLARVDIPLFIDTAPDEEVSKAFEHHSDLADDDKDIVRWILLWAWSRKKGQVIWTANAMAALKSLTPELTHDFSIARPPIFQSTEARVRVARMAVAIAARLFSTKDGENLLVKSDHVQAACNLYRMFFSDDHLGITDIRAGEIATEEAEDLHSDEVRTILRNSPSEVREKLASGAFDKFEYGASYEVWSLTSELVDLKAIRRRTDDQSKMYIVSKWARDIAIELEREGRK